MPLFKVGPFEPLYHVSGIPAKHANGVDFLQHVKLVIFGSRELGRVTALSDIISAAVRTRLLELGVPKNTIMSSPVLAGYLAFAGHSEKQYS